MKIVHLSYAYIPAYNDPYQWLKSLPFFTGIVSTMAKKHEVISVHSINYEGIIDYKGAQFHFIKARVWQNLIPFRTNRYVKKLKPDIVIVHGFHFLWNLLWLRFYVGSKVKILVQHHAEKPFTFPKKYLQQWVDTFVAGYFFTSLDLAVNWINGKLISTQSKVYEVMETSSEFYATNKSIARQRTGVENTKVYLWVGRFDANKDPLTLVKAFIAFIMEFPEAKLYVVYTQADLLNEINDLIKEYRANIILVGSLPHEELAYWFNSADFIISTSHYESSGIAVCEGMSCGCIPIVSDIPSFRMMTNHGTCGLLFTPGDRLHLLSVLKKSATLNSNNERMKTLEQFQNHLSFEAIALKIDRIISSLAE